MHEQYNVKRFHVFREANQLVDILANFDYVLEGLFRPFYINKCLKGINC